MSDNKRYYYLKLKDNYFDKESIKILESLENGYIYSNILLKLTLISLKHEGRLRFKSTLPYNEKMLATITGHDIDNIRSALKIFKELELIEKLEDGTIYMLELQELIGESSTEADRLKKYRKRIKEEKQQQISDQCTNVQETYIKQTPELELELKKEREEEKKNTSAKIKKDRYLDYVLLTKPEYDKLIERYKERDVKEYIERLNNYVGGNGRKYKSHYFTILNWMRKDNIQLKPKQKICPECKQQYYGTSCECGWSI